MAYLSVTRKLFTTYNTFLSALLDFSAQIFKLGRFNGGNNLFGVNFVLSFGQFGLGINKMKTRFKSNCVGSIKDERVTITEFKLKVFFRHGVVVLFKLRQELIIR